MSEHTKEPWRWGGKGGGYIVAGELNDPLRPGETFWCREAYGSEMVCESVSEADGRRIIACVNACSDLTTDELEAALRAGRRLVVGPVNPDACPADDVVQ